MSGLSDSRLVGSAQPPCTLRRWIEAIADVSPTTLDRIFAIREHAWCESGNDNRMGNECAQGHGVAWTHATAYT